MYLLCQDVNYLALAPRISSEDLLGDMCGGGDKAEAIFKTKKTLTLLTLQNLRGGTVY